MPRVRVKDIDIHYQQRGEGPDLVLIHGITGDMSTWYLQVMPALAKEFRVTAYDLRGHGYSDVTASGYTSAHMAADLCALLDGLGIERAHLVGHSFGGTIALHCAGLYPERVASLVLGEPMVPALQSLLDMQKWPYLNAVQTMLEERGVSIPEEKVSDWEYVTRKMVHSPIRIGLRRGLERNSRRLRRLLERTAAIQEAQEVAGLTMERISEIRHPILAIYGEVSYLLQMVPYLEKGLTNCQVVILKDVAHFFALSKPELLVTRVMEFHRELAEKGRGK
jgi:pimeloyl-ACP methyl ester carboxylesterase